MSKKDNDELQTTFPEKWAKVLKELPEFKEAAIHEFHHYN